MDDPFEVSYSLENERQFWDAAASSELDEIVSVPSGTHALIDNALRSYLHFTSTYRADYLPSEDELTRCSDKLLESPLFAAQSDYVRRQFVYSLLQEDSDDTLHLITSLLLVDGRNNEVTFEMMNEEEVFSRLVELIGSRPTEDDDLRIRLLNLLYEMSRINRISIDELRQLDPAFITTLFDLNESPPSSYVAHPYHYPVIRVLLVLNEQYMVSCHPPPSPPLLNLIMDTLSHPPPHYRTFGSNLILLLNRESETSLQLLILKLLYLLFTTPATYEYFYTNDLRVLVDVMIRNLLDLPDDIRALRHTYLRVLYPLLIHTQLCSEGYKRSALRDVLSVLGREPGGHFGEVDTTTRRLVERCRGVPWLSDTEDERSSSPSSITKRTPESGRGRLGISLGSAAAASSVSVVEVAKQQEKPGVMTRSRKDDTDREMSKGRVATRSVSDTTPSPDAVRTHVAIHITDSSA